METQHVKLSRKTPGSRRRMLLVLPYDNTYFFRGYFKKSVSYAPLTLTTLAALVPDSLDFEIEIIDEGVSRIDTEKCFYDIVGITCVTSSAPRAFELSAIFRSKGSITVLGGAYPTLNPDNASKHADIVVSGHAERIWPQLLLDLCSGAEVARIHRSGHEEVISSPVPRRDLLPQGKYLDVPTVIASRGCLNQCSFCSINRIWNNSTCPRPADEVIAEIRDLKSRNILMLDPNIGSNRNYALGLFEKMIPLNIRWAGLATIDLAEDRELFSLAVKSGCIGILAGFESALQGGLTECRKGNIQTSRYREYIQTFHRHGISILGCFVLGFDCEDESVFDRTVQFIEALEIDIPRFSVLTPFPGTPLYQKYKDQGRILTDDLSYYDTEHVIFTPAGMTPQRLQQGLHEVWQKAYSIRKIFQRAVRSPANKLFSFAINSGFRHYAKKIVKRGKAVSEHSYGPVLNER